MSPDPARTSHLEDLAAEAHRALTEALAALDRLEGAQDTGHIRKARAAARAVRHLITVADTVHRAALAPTGRHL